MRPRPHPTVLLLAIALTACAGGAGGTATRNSSVITLDELEQVANFSAYEAIERLRPAWLRNRGTSSAMYAADQFPSVLVDNAHNTLDALRSIRADHVETMRFIDGRDATTRYGTGYVNGIIEVMTRR